MKKYFLKVEKKNNREKLIAKTPVSKFATRNSNLAARLDLGHHKRQGKK